MFPSKIIQIRSCGTNDATAAITHMHGFGNANPVAVPGVIYF